MGMYMDFIIKIITNVLTNLYQIAGFALIMSALFMFMYISAEEHGWKEVMRKWWLSFKENSSFRRIFGLAFYTTMILFKTLFNRGLWFRPLENIVGIWGFFDKQGIFTTEVIENMILFIPFTILYLWAFREKIITTNKKVGSVVGKATIITFVISLSIEFLQLFLRIGTFQLSDLFYNTLGGLIGGLIYWIGYKLNHRKK